MIAEIVLLSIGVLGVIIASITDIKSREIPDWLCYSMIFSGLGIRTIISLSSLTYWPLLEGLIGFGIFFLVANLMYYTKQWGGGDSKLLMGLGAIFGNGLEILHLQNAKPFTLSFFLNLFIIGALYGLALTICIAFKHRRKIFQEIQKEK